MIGVSAAVLIGMPGTAQAASNYNGKCGAGYGEIDHLELPGANIYLTYSASTGKNCVVTVRDVPGAAKPMSAYVMRTGDPFSNDLDKGDFTAYAGPVFVYAPNTCIEWGGRYDQNSLQRTHDHCN
ncbi:spore-associated protein A [Streptomyces sp. NPDC088115]|uniref:spore-associated protein A n=1 Tax=Streptomyces sp. NPDC088115 TaxID=3365824 RepID=UPI00382C2952